MSVTRNLSALIFLLLSLSAGAQTDLPKPAQFLGYELGERFTSHQRMVDYFKAVDLAVPNMQVVQYGETYEHRPLIYATLTSPENFKNLEQIRNDNLRRAGILDDAQPGNKIAIVWMSYGVHGNEASSTEAAMKTLYDLVNPANIKSQTWLKNTVVIIDPCINPDGRERYVNFYNQYGNNPPNADHQSFEHREPWPGGRFNHYLFDLNRDWAWETQTESKSRLEVYNHWLPHVHVDFHEQSPSTPYYFAPAAEPYHDEITPWQREFQTIIGKNNAKYFDQNGWLYFTKERFDLYYPGYGDTYPMFNGAIGMTYEKGGGGSAGLIAITIEGDPITLKDRLLHHYTTSMSTVEISSQHATRLVDEFQKYFREVNTRSISQFKSFVILEDNNPDKLNKITSWMTTHDIKFGHPAAGKPLKGFDFQSQSVTNFNLSPGDVIVNVDQPKGRLVTTFFGPQSKLADSLTYDITSWNFIYSFNLKAFALNEKIPVVKPYQAKTAPDVPVPANPYAYIFRYKGLEDVAFLAELMQRGVKVRSAKKAFTSGTQTFDAGTLIVTRRNNEGVNNFDQIVELSAKKLGRQIYTTSTGFVDKGFDFGSTEVNYIKPPKVALLGGDQTYSSGHGEIWFYFEQQIHYPVSILRTDYFKSVDLWSYNVLIVPDGSYRLFDEPTLDMLQRWINDGGKLILIGEALNSFVDKKGFGLKEYATEEKKKEAEKKDKEEKEKEGPIKYDEAERRQLSESISGAIYKIVLDKSHPLAFGLGSDYYSLKINELHYEFLENGWNVGTIRGQAKPVLGFAGYKINKKMSNTLTFGVENKGRGQIVYLVDNPLFRSFWEDGKMLFSNAVFMVGQ